MDNTHSAIRGHQQKQTGFSLLEIMVVLVIFSMIAIGSLSVLTNLLHSRKTLEEHGQRLEGLQWLLLTARHDMSEIVPKTDTTFSVKNDDQGASYISTHEDGSISFTRGGWQNPLNEQRSALAYSTLNVAKDAFREDTRPAAADSVKSSILSQYLSGDAVNIKLRTVTLTQDAGSDNPSSKPSAASGDIAASSAVKPPTAAQSTPVAADVVFSLSTFGDVEELIPVVQKP